MANVINKGIRTKVVARGNLFTIGQSYACTLYKDVKKQDGRATTTAIAQDVGGKNGCIFVFEPQQTSSLLTGNVVLEIYDNITLDQMSYVENYATVRATSLSS